MWRMLRAQPYLHCFIGGSPTEARQKASQGNITIVRILQWECMGCCCAVPLNVCTYSFHCVSALWWYGRPSPFLVLYKCSNFIGNSNPPPPPPKKKRLTPPPPQTPHARAAGVGVQN